MKKYFKIISIFLLIILCSGCVKYEGNMKIDKYKGMDLSVKILTNDGEDRFSREAKDAMIKNGFSINDYKEDNYVGVVAEYQTKDIDKISNGKKEDYNLVDMDTKGVDGMFTVKKGLFKNRYSSNIIFDPTKYLYNYQCSDGSIISYSEYSEDMFCFIVQKDIVPDTFKFSVEVEGGTLSNNAAEVVDDTLVWNVDNGSVTKIEFEFERTNYFNIMIIAIVVVLIVMFILTSIANGITIHDKEKILEEKRKKAKKEAMAERVVKKETVKKKRAEVKKEVEDTALSNMYNGNKGSKAIPEMKKEDVEKSGMVESSFKDLYK